MNEKISALVDGEMDRDDAANLVKLVANDAGRRDTWDCYHLVGEVMRGEHPVSEERHRSTTASIFAKLAEEPTVLAPKAIAQDAPVEKRTRMAMAMAASVVTVSAIAVVAFKQQNSAIEAQVAANRGVMQNPVTLAQPAQAAPSSQQQVRVNDYLAIHRQFANPAAFQSAAVRGEQRAQQANR